VPVIVTDAGEFAAATYVAVQLPPDNVQELVLKEPPAPPSLNAIAPVGVVGEFDVSDTEIVIVAVPPEFNELGLDEINVLVGSGVFELVELVFVWLVANARIL